jgi:4-hydroxyproline epimerase
MSQQRIRVIDSHTGGEPTRVVIPDELHPAPDLGSGSLAERRERFRLHHDAFRRAVTLEPRGSDVLVGALLCPPSDPRCVAGVIFFNNVGYLNMCGHGAIGLAVTLGHLDRIEAGRHLLETPVGIVPFEYDGENRVRLDNVPSYRLRQAVSVPVKGFGTVTGDVAWGGNWFYLVEHDSRMPELHRTRTPELTSLCVAIKEALAAEGVTGADHAEIDHIELFGEPTQPRNDARNFVLCPGSAYDRSPCGTGTSAKLACLVADGKLALNAIWRQESIVGSVFEGFVHQQGTDLIPSITGDAWITAETILVFDPTDPFVSGIPT